MYTRLAKYLATYQIWQVCVYRIWQVCTRAVRMTRPTHMRDRYTAVPPLPPTARRFAHPRAHARARATTVATSAAACCGGTRCHDGIAHARVAARARSSF